MGVIARRFVVGAGLSTLLGSVAAATLTYSTSQECRDVVSAERQRWQKAYDEHTQCWIRNRCGNPGADPRLTQWARQNTHLSEQCNLMQQAEYARARAERDRVQAEIEARSKMPTPEPPRRTTTIPVSPPQAARQPSDTSKTAAAISALGELMRQMNERDAQEEEAAPAPPPGPSPAEIRRVEQEQRMRDNRDLAKRAFDAARLALGTHPAVVMIQEAAWSRLQEQLDVVPREMEKLDRIVAEVTSAIPAAADVDAGTGRIAARRFAVMGESMTLAYVGDLDARGVPTGAGRLTGVSGGKSIDYRGGFEQGAVTGPGRLEIVDGSVVTVWEGELSKGQPVGVGVQTLRTKGTNAFREITGTYAPLRGASTATSSGRSSTVRIRTHEGYVYRGVMVDGKKHGPGTETRPDGTSLSATYVNDEAEGWGRQSGPQWKLECFHRKSVCNGPARKTFRNGNEIVGVQRDGDWIGDVSASYIYDDGSVELYEGPLRKGLRHGVGRIVFSSGDVYEGTLQDGGRRGESFGLYQGATGWRHEGRFVDRQLVDGLVMSATGETQIKGTGVGTPVPRYTRVPPPAELLEVSRTSTLAAAPDTPPRFDKASSALDDSAYRHLDELLARISRERLQIEVIMLTGYTDDRRPKEAALALSLKRAESAKSYLISKGMEAGRLYAEGKAGADPIGNSNTAAGRAQNNRVEIDVVATGPLKAKVNFGTTMTVKK